MRPRLRRTIDRVRPVAYLRPLTVAGLLMLLPALATLSGCSKGPGPDTKAPPVPTGLIITRGIGRVTLAWTTVSANDLEGYYAYHKEGAGGTPVRSDLLDVNTTVVFGLTNGVEYFFYITSVDESGNESDPSTEVSATPNNAENLTESGWLVWEAGDYAAADPLFQDALVFDGDYADAFNGLGWTALSLGNLSEAVIHFQMAVGNELETEDARVGLLAANKELPGQLSQAAANGILVLQNDPNYVFSHDPSIDADLVRLMLSQVYFRLGESYFGEAQTLMDVVVPGNGLDLANPATWVVDSTTFSTYAAALIALIEFAFDL